jgi:hypothetical protein
MNVLQDRPAGCCTPSSGPWIVQLVADGRGWRTNPAVSYQSDLLMVRYEATATSGDDILGHSSPELAQAGTPGTLCPMLMGYRLLEPIL